MKHCLPVLLALMIGALMISSCGKPVSKQAKPPMSVYDSAVEILKDFVISGGDKCLGLADEAECNAAYIDLPGGIDVYYLRYDTLAKTNAKAIDSILINLGRRVYPVYTKTTGGDKLCSAITFDSAGGVRAIQFDDSTLVAEYVTDRKKMLPLDSTTTYAMIEMPFIHNTVIYRHDKQGAHIISTKSLKIELGIDFPKPSPVDRRSLVESDEFFANVKLHLTR